MYIIKIFTLIDDTRLVKITTITKKKIRKSVLTQTFLFSFCYVRECESVFEICLIFDNQRH